jgi:hypothetical protein
MVVATCGGDVWLPDNHDGSHELWECDVTGTLIILSQNRFESYRKVDIHDPFQSKINTTVLIPD